MALFVAFCKFLEMHDGLHKNGGISVWENRIKVLCPCCKMETVTPLLLLLCAYSEDLLGQELSFIWEWTRVLQYRLIL